MQLTYENLDLFLQRPGINAVGFCKDAGISRQYLRDLRKGNKPLTDTIVKKLNPYLIKYGFYATDDSMF